MLKTEGPGSFRNDLTCLAEDCDRKTAIRGTLFTQHRQGKVITGASTGYCSKHATKADKATVLAEALKSHALKSDQTSKLEVADADRIAQADALRAIAAEAREVAKAEAEASEQAASEQAASKTERKPRQRKQAQAAS